MFSSAVFAEYQCLGWKRRRQKGSEKKVGGGERGKGREEAGRRGGWRETALKHKTQKYT